LIGISWLVGGPCGDTPSGCVTCRGPAREDSLAFERVEERDHRGAVDAQHGRGFLL
jgi:hypothetical protein